MRSRQSKQRGAVLAPLCITDFAPLLEVSATGFMAAIAIEFDCLARAFTGSAAIFTTWLWRTGTNRILTLFFFVLVCHGSSSDFAYWRSSAQISMPQSDFARCTLMSVGKRMRSH